MIESEVKILGVVQNMPYDCVHWQAMFIHWILPLAFLNYSFGCLFVLYSWYAMAALFTQTPGKLL